MGRVPLVQAMIVRRNQCPDTGAGRHEPSSLYQWHPEFISTNNDAGHELPRCKGHRAAESLKMLN